MFNLLQKMAIAWNMHLFLSYWLIQANIHIQESSNNNKINDHGDVVNC